MSEGTSQSVPRTGGEAGDRRSFIRRVSAAGLALAAGGGAVAQVRGGQTQVQSMPRLPAGESGSEPVLSLEGAVNLVTPASSPGRSALAELRLREAPRAPLRPSTKGELLDAIASQPEGASALAALGITPTGAGRGATPFSGSTGLGLALAGDPLAKAYAKGVTLEPTGCVYAPGIVVDHQPLVYYTDCVVMGTAGVSKLPSLKSLVLSGQHLGPEDHILEIQITAAGTPDITLRYILELDLEWATALNAQLNGSAVTWSESSKGTHVALTTLPGGNWQGHLRFRPKSEAWEPYWGSFNWLRVTAV